MMHTHMIDPIAFTLGNFSVRWYGVMHLIAFLLAFWFCASRRQSPSIGKPWTLEQIADLFFYVAIGVILGGTMGYWLIYEPSRLLEEPLLLFKFWLPGRSFHGGLIGVILAVLIYAHQQGRKLLEITDFIAPAVPIGLGLGRLGNYLNGELWGRETDLPWGIVFPNAGELARHPSQLYEFGLEGVALFTILYYFTRERRGMGAASGMFLLCYGFFRFLVEFVREPDPGSINLLWFTMGQVLSVPMILLGGWLLWRANGFTPQKNGENSRLKSCNNT